MHRKRTRSFIPFSQEEILTFHITSPHLLPPARIGGVPFPSPPAFPPLAAILLRARSLTPGSRFIWSMVEGGLWSLQAPACFAPMLAKLPLFIGYASPVSL